MFNSLIVIVSIAFMQTPVFVKAATAPTSPDNVFILIMASSSYSETKFSEIAQSKTSNSEIKILAERIADTSQADTQTLQKIVSSNPDLTMPTDYKQVYQKQINLLTNFSGKIFDASYVTLEYAQLKSAVSSYRYEAENGVNSDLKNFASERLPIVKDEYQKIEEVRNSIPEIANSPVPAIPDLPMALKIFGATPK